MHLNLFKDLGYTGIEPQDDVKLFKEFLNSDLTKDNVLVICSGQMANDEQIIKYIIDFNKSQSVPKVRNVIVFCGNMNYHKKWLKEYLESPGFVLKVVNQFF